MATGNPNDVRRDPDPMVNSGLGCGWAWLWFWLFLIVILFGGWGWGGWYRGWGGPWGWWGPRQPVQQGQQSNRPQASPPSGEFLGRIVILTGKVDHVFSPHAFTLVGGEGGQPLLVVFKENKPEVKQGETVEITGKVEKYEEAELHKETGVDLNKVPAGEYGGKPAVVASKVSPKSSTAGNGG